MKKTHSIILLVLILAAIATVAMQPKEVSAFSYFDWEETPWNCTFLYNHHSEEGHTNFRLYENGSLLRAWTNLAHDLYHARLRWVKQVAEVGVSWALSISTDGYQGWCNGTYEVAPIIVYVVINQTVVQIVEVNVTEYIVVGNNTNVEIVYVNQTQIVLVNNTTVLVIPQTEYILVPELVYVNSTEAAMAADAPNPLLFSGAGLIGGLALGVGYRRKDD